MAYEDAMEEALSFGWIDSRVNALDEERYMQVFTPGSQEALGLNQTRKE